MTGRELIRRICESVENFDEEIPIRILHRDDHSGVTHRQNVTVVFFINGKLSIEASGIDQRESAVGI